MSSHPYNRETSRENLSRKPSNIEKARRITGLGISSIDPATTRERSYTIDSLNISPIEPSQYSRLRSGDDHGHFDEIDESTRYDDQVHQDFSGAQPKENWERATWEFSDILQSLTIKDKDDLNSMISKCNLLVPLLADHPSLRSEIVVENVVAKVQFMLYDHRSQVRAAAYRVLRHSSATLDALLHLVQSKILIFLIVTISTPTPLLEKEEAVKLVREFVNIPGGVRYLSVGIVKALVAFIEHEHEDPPGEMEINMNTNMNNSQDLHGFTRTCIETVAEIAVIYPEIAFHGGGIRLMINLIINGSMDISVSCITTLLTLLDMPHARLFLRNGADLDCLMSVFTLFEDDDKDTKTPNTRKYYLKALKMSFILSCLLKTWSGLICFSRNNFDPIRMLLSNLKKRNVKLCSVILDLLLDVLRVQSLPWLEESSIGDLLASLHQGYSGGEDPISFEYLKIERGNFQYSLMSHYQGLLSMILINCDTIPLLFHIINEDRSKENTEKAIFLLTNLFDLSSKYLPPKFYQTHVHSAYNTHLSIASLNKIEAATKKKQINVNDSRNSNVKDIVRDITNKLHASMENTSFKTLISRTRVLSVKEFDEWNWSLLSQFFQGPLRIASRFSELQEKYPKFLKTFMSFLRPFKYRFSSVPVTASSRYPKIRKPKIIIVTACQLIEGLLATEAGCSVLSSSKLMQQLTEIISQIDPTSNINSHDPILGRRRLEHSLSVGYVKMVGIMSSHPRGIKILEYWQLFSMIRNIVEFSADDNNNCFIFNILDSLDYSISSHSKTIVVKAIGQANWKVKMYVIEHILPNISEIPEYEQFCISSLVKLFHEEHEVISKAAVGLLHKLVNTPKLINTLVECRPSISCLERSKKGKRLLLQICTTSTGFKYLEENGFINRQFLLSLESLQTLNYLTSVEENLRASLFPYTRSFCDELASSKHTAGDFFHHLLQTEEGFNYFNNRRNFIDEAVFSIMRICRVLKIIDIMEEPDDYISVKRPDFLPASSSYNSSESQGDSTYTPKDFRHWPPSANWAKSSSSGCGDVSPMSVALFTPNELVDQDHEYLLKRLKQYIWMVGEIASSNYGIQILEPVYSASPGHEHIVKILVTIFQKAKHWQLRGLAFFQIGRIAGTVEGVEILDELDWLSFKSSQEEGVWVAYPKSMREGTFTEVEVLNPYQDVSYYSLFGIDENLNISENIDLDLEDDVIIKTYEKMDEKVLGLLNYSSTVLGRIERKAVKELKRIKNDTPQVFENTGLFLKTIRLVDRGKFKYRVRCFIFELFNTMKIMEGLVKKNRKLSSVRRQTLDSTTQERGVPSPSSPQART